MRISDWSSDVCSSDLKKLTGPGICNREFELFGTFLLAGVLEFDPDALRRCASGRLLAVSLGTGVERFDLAQLLAELVRSEEHTSELQSLMRISYAVFCLKKKKTTHMKSSIHHIFNTKNQVTQKNITHYKLH